MLILLQSLAFVCFVASLVFFIMVVIQMFKRDQTTLGIVCIVLAPCMCIGPLVAFVFGWMKATEWNLKKIMTYWTVAFVLYFILGTLAYALMLASAAPMVRDEIDVDPNNMNLEFNIDQGDLQMPDDSMPAEPSVDDVPPTEESSTDQP
ncbi:MAG: hypothetical protein ABI614_15040 [Planctomycetota bacterium]